MLPDELLTLVSQHMESMGWKYFDLAGLLCKLLEELGELGQTLEDKGHLKEEIGDNLFAVSCMANSYGINFGEKRV